MSVKDRLEDARILYANGRKEGALLSVLVAVAATSRKRYPKGTMKDSDAFTKFVGEEMRTITGCGENLNIQFRGNMMPLQDLLYKYMRCELAHEAELPEDIIFEPGRSLRVEVTDKQVIFSDRLLEGLSRAVAMAPENADVFGKAESGVREEMTS